MTFLQSLRLVDWALIAAVLLLIGAVAYIAHLRQERSLAEHHLLVAVGKLWRTESQLEAVAESRDRWKGAYEQLQDIENPWRPV